MFSKKLELIATDIELAKEKPYKNVYYKIVEDFLTREGDRIEVSKDGFGKRGVPPNKYFRKNKNTLISFRNFDSLGLYAQCQLYKRGEVNAYFVVNFKSIRNREVINSFRNFRRYYNAKVKELGILF